MAKLITPVEAAAILTKRGRPISDYGVRQLITRKRLRAVKYGTSWMIDPADLRRIEAGTVGRPPASAKPRRKAR